MKSAGAVFWITALLAGLFGIGVIASINLVMSAIAGLMHGSQTQNGDLWVIA